MEKNIFLGLTPPAGCAVWAQISARTSLHLPAAIMTPCWGCVDLGAMLGHVGSMLGLCGALLGPRRLMFDQNWG